MTPFIVFYLLHGVAELCKNQKKGSFNNHKFLVSVLLVSALHINGDNYIVFLLHIQRTRNLLSLQQTARIGRKRLPLPFFMLRKPFSIVRTMLIAEIFKFDRGKRLVYTNAKALFGL